ncbi:polysaccharide biosynthesis protein [Variovorax sp. Root473]|uniref:polysaccharide biosynthesis protein n=1 Tax=Variovorax sp. Root473 TaxID=1736541 RepID=UPI0006F33689|nr:polysaccharide biosynthesis protein [Variovorax sp. Root473]KQX94906.1 polysaccharide biosynthesis protein [Variovorax sp. Root473]
MSSLKSSIVASYTSQIYIALVGIIMMPMYLKYMGSEAYGLVGFFTMLQVWFQLLDFGLSPTLARECARYKGGATDGLTLRRLVRALEVIFVIIGATMALCLAMNAGWVATTWLKVVTLSPVQVSLAVQLMAVTVALRWLSGLYRGALGGLESLVWLGGFNIAVATARFVLVVPVLHFVGATPTVFFAYQVLVVGIEAFVLVWRTYASLPTIDTGVRVGLHFRALRGTLGFSLSIAFTGGVWVAVTQADKLILSTLLPLSDYAHFTLAVLLASGVTIISGPLSSALLPRLSRLHAQSADAEAIALYRQATQGMALIAATIALVLALAAEQILFAWTGDRALAESAAPILRLYALGNGILSLAAFPYYLQFSRGDVRLHLIGNVIFLGVLVPSIVYATLRHGAVGAGWTWLGANILYGLLWVPLVHRKFAPGLHMQWLGRDIAVILLPAAVAAVVLTLWTPWPSGRIALGALVVLVTLGVFVAALPFSSLVRTTFAQWRAPYRQSGTVTIK